MKRLKIFLFTGVVALALSSCGEKLPPNMVNSPEDINDRVIGVFGGSPSARLADELGVAMPLGSSDELMSNLKVGNVDCVIMEYTVAVDLVAETSGVKLLGESLLEYDLRFAVAKENAELLDAVNSALASLNSNGTLNGLRGKYFAGRSYAYAPPGDVAPRPGTLILAVSPDDYPYSYRNESGGYSGLNIDVARAVCDSLGVGLQIAEFETGELITAVWFGKADLALGWLPGDVGDAVNISDAYALLSHVVIVRK